MARISLVRQIEEPQFAKIIARELGKQRRAVLEQVRQDVPQMDDLFWEEHMESMTAAVVPVLVSIYDRAIARVATDILTGKQDLIGDLATRALRWARMYGGTLVRQLANTTQRAVREALVTMIATPGMTIRDFTDTLTPIFGAARAETIAVTEFTRAHFEGSREAADEIRRVGFNMVGIWFTANDEDVCRFCGPLEGKRETTPGSGQWAHPDGDHFSPPAHPRCRCDIGYELI